MLAYDKRHGYRGPESNLLGPRVDAASPAEIDQEAAQEDVDGGLQDLEQMALAHLRNLPTPGGLAAAVVLRADDSVAEVVLADGRKIELTLASMAWARPYESVNVRGAPPTTVAQVLRAGDVIRIRENEEADEANDDANDDELATGTLE